MNSKKSSRRIFLKHGATLAAMTAAGVQAASAQGFDQDPKLRTDYAPEDQIPKDHVWRDPWTGEMMRDEEGNLIVDWTGTPQWDRYRKNAQEMGKKYGTMEVDSLAPWGSFPLRQDVPPGTRRRFGLRFLRHADRAKRQQDLLLLVVVSDGIPVGRNHSQRAALRGRACRSSRHRSSRASPHHFWNGGPSSYADHGRVDGHALGYLESILFNATPMA